MGDLGGSLLCDHKWPKWLTFRLSNTSNGNIEKGVQKRLFQKNQLEDFDLDDHRSLDRLYVGYHVFRRLVEGRNPNQPLDQAIYGKIYAYLEMFFEGTLDVTPETITQNLLALNGLWQACINAMRKTSKFGKKYYRDKKTGEVQEVFMESRYYKSGRFARDIRDFCAAAKAEQSRTQG